MKSPFVNPHAFAPFFDETIVIEGVRANGARVNTTVRACVVDNGFDDSLGDGDPANTRRSFSIWMPLGAWLYGELPQIGDIVRLRDGARLAVSRVSRDESYVTMETREC